MNEIMDKNIEIENMIYEVRGVQVMLDSDLAKLYECKNGTKSINLAVNRHLNRFPNRIAFKLTKEESENIRFQIETKNGKKETRGGKYSEPYVFTEQGVAMLATVLRTEVAAQMSIAIMDAFVKMRKYFVNNNDILINHENRILKLEKSFDRYSVLELNKIFFEGQMYDAYSIFIDILNKTKKEVIIIDNYAGKELLDILKNIDKKIIIVSKNIDNILKDKYEKQYSNVTFINNDSFHDRFIIIDRNILYTSGSSFKDIGKKCFAITELDNNYIDEIIKVINIKG